MNLSPRGIREHLKLNKPIYARTSAYGHFGRPPGSGRRLLLGKDRPRRRIEETRLIGACDGVRSARRGQAPDALWPLERQAASAHRARLVEELLPRLKIDRAALAEPTKLFEFAPDEIRLEIGFGGGEHLARCAAESPDVGFIGCEPFLNGVAKLLAAIEAGGLGNIRVHMGDARALVEALSPASLSLIYVLYPDPWPKRRHMKRRIVSNETVALFARVIKRGGEVRFATDIDDYAGWTLRRFAVSPGFPLARRARRRLAQAMAGLAGDALRGESARRRARFGVPHV